MLWLQACSEYGVEEVEKSNEASPSIEVEPASIDFGVVPPDCIVETEVTVRNVGDATLHLDSVTAVGDGFTVENPEIDLLAGEQTQVTVRFSPGWEGDFDGALDVRSNDIANPSVPVVLDGVASSTVATVETFVQGSTAIDVLWVMDNSSSMSQEQARVAADIVAFFGQFVDYGADYHMGVVATDIVNTELSGRLVGEPTFIDPSTPDGQAELAEALALGEEDMGDESGLRAAELALSEPLTSTDNAGFYRTDATLAVVFLSDEPEQSEYDAQHYIDFFGGLKTDPSKLSISAIVGDEKTGCATECDGAAEDAQPGDKYIAVAEAFSGVVASLCTCDISIALTDIGADAVALLSSFELSSSPVDETITVMIDASESSSWSYDAANNAIDMSEPPPEGSTVTVTYAVAAECPSD